MRKREKTDPKNQVTTKVYTSNTIDLLVQDTIRVSMGAVGKVIGDSWMT